LLGRLLPRQSVHLLCLAWDGKLKGKFKKRKRPVLFF